jgi:23S rRNA (adenine2030-N6)-methyltransferase
LNYAHDFHAGNFADVFKHIFLTRILLYLALKPAPLRFIETHAGSGLYDLSAEKASRAGEWRGGVQRLLAAPLDGAAAALIQPYADIVAPLLGSDPPRYPGSPLIASALLRRQDRLIACEIHPDAFARLKDNLRPDRRAKAINIDGYHGLKAFIPPVERRGLVLIDPPFEDADEFARLAEALPAAARKWASGVFMLWHPVKDRPAADAFAAALARGFAASGITRVLRLELGIGSVEARGPLARSGLIIANPPFPLEAEAERILPHLARRLGETGADHLIARLGGQWDSR